MKCTRTSIIWIYRTQQSICWGLQPNTVCAYLMRTQELNDNIHQLGITRDISLPFHRIYLRNRPSPTVRYRVQRSKPYEKYFSKHSYCLWQCHYNHFHIMFHQHFYQIQMGNSVVTDVQFGHLFLVCVKYDALQEVTYGLFRKISHCS